MSELVGVVPQVNKFEQVSIDDHLISVSGGMGADPMSGVWMGEVPQIPQV